MAEEGGPLDWGQSRAGKGVETQEGRRSRFRFFARERQAQSLWLRYAQAVLLATVATLLGEWVHPFLSLANLVMIYLLAVVVAALYLGRGPSIVVAVLSVVAFDFFFVPPFLTLVVSDAQDLFTFISLFLVGLVISNLTALAREQAQAAERRAAQTAEIYALSRDLAATASLEGILAAILTHVRQTFGGQSAVYLAHGEQLRLRAASPDFAPGEQELRSAEAVFRKGRGAAATAAPPGRVLLPLVTAHEVLGVLGVWPVDTGSSLPPEQLQLLEAFASQAALAIERAQLAEQASYTKVLQATEQLQTALLNSISHDLRTPLVSILGALSSLQEDADGLDAANRRNLIDNAREEADRLNRLVGNLLDMTRIAAGALKVRVEVCDVQDVIGSAMEHLNERVRDRPVRIEVPSELPLVPLDFVLMEQVLVNLIDNAIKYSEPGTPIDVQAWVEGAEAQLQVADLGAGIPAEDLDRVFDKFYRVQQPLSVRPVGGTGLGLSICKGIVEAHGGRIWAEQRPGGGTRIRVALPLAGDGGEAR